MSRRYTVPRAYVAGVLSVLWLWAVSLGEWGAGLVLVGLFVYVHVTCPRSPSVAELVAQFEREGKEPTP